MVIVKGRADGGGQGLVGDADGGDQCFLFTDRVRELLAGAGKRDQLRAVKGGAVGDAFFRVSRAILGKQHQCGCFAFALREGGV